MPDFAERPELAAARLMLEKLGVDPADLLGAPAEPVYIPTFAEFLPRVRRATSAGSLKAYGPYWNRLEEKWPHRRITEPTHIELMEFAEELKANRVQRRNGRHGDGVVENFVGAVRKLYRMARDEQLLSEHQDPSRNLKKPDRPQSLRRPLEHNRLQQLGEVAGSTGDDPELDQIIIRLHQETACRRGGALALRPMDLDEEQLLIRLTEKGGSDRWQPVSRTLMTGLLQLAKSRNAPWDGRLLRYKDGTPITYRRYDHLFARLGQHLSWVLRENVSAHWIRHTILRWVERTFGYPIARKYGGHERKQRGGQEKIGTTIVYVTATLEEIAAALSVLTGEIHPLADRQLLARHGLTE